MEPGVGVHEWHIATPFDGPTLAGFDLIGTAIAAIILVMISGEFTILRSIKMFAGLWLLGIIIHMMLGINTSVNVWIRNKL